MRKDPVCQMTVDERSPHRSLEAGRTYLFCSPGCKAKFDREPGPFLTESGGKIQAASRP